MEDVKLSSFLLNDTTVSVSFVETQVVKEGVKCDVYTLDGDNSRDLAIVRVEKGSKTPLQKVIKGVETIEGYVSGSGTLTVQSQSGTETYEYLPDTSNEPVLVGIGETMQWEATGTMDLIFYEVCAPPYQDGRFENLDT